MEFVYSTLDFYEGNRSRSIRYAKNDTTKMDKKVEEAIQRLGEICGAAGMIAIGDELKAEQETLVNYLKEINVIELNGKGFSFVSEEHKILFLDARENF